MELAGDVAGVQLEKGFLKRLALAPSNVDFFKHGGEVYRQLVLTAQISFRQVAAQYAITSLFRNHKSGFRRQEVEDSPLATSHQPLTTNSSQHVYCYTVHQIDYQLQRMGTLTLAVGQLKLVSEITWESEHLVFAVLHLGGWDFHCCIQPFTGRRAYSQMKEKIFEALQQASAAYAIRAMTQMFGDQSFSLQNLLVEERHRIMQLLSHETLTRLDQLYTQVYRDNYGVLMAFHRDRLPVPQELQVAAEIALSHRCLNLVRSLCEEVGEPQSSWEHLTQLEAVATEAKHLRCQLKLPEVKQTLEQLILRSLWQLLHNANSGTVEVEIQRLERLIEVGSQLNLDLSLGRVQETYFKCLHSQIVPQCLQLLQNQISEVADGQDNCNEANWDITHLQHLLRLGQKLAVDVGAWLDQIG
jgi:alpha-amylase/alpha-mannosidase (GH57 family)